jgi:hypothetical protein
MKRIDATRPGPSRRLGLGPGAFMALLVLVVAGCGILDESGTPSSARVVIEGGSVAAIALVTSNDFSIISDDGGQTRDVYLNTWDSIDVTPPLDQRYSLGPAVRFFLRVGAEEALVNPVRVRVVVGGKERFDATSDLAEGDLEFVYSSR